MRVATIAVGVLVAATLAFGASTTDKLPPKREATPLDGPGYHREGGETIETAVAVPALPYIDTGNTCDNINNYDEACPYGDSESPDVVYSYTPAEDMCISVSLCNSWYDTKVYIYEDAWTPGTFVACNDDNFDCVDPPVLYTSWIPEAQLYVGHTYYFVVDGYGGACGDYTLEMMEVECLGPCVLECPPEGIAEGEPDCYDGYDDTYNGGCLSVPPSFSHVTPSTETTTICGTSGNYDDNTYRDTDWYLFTLSGMYESAAVTACVDAEFPVFLGFIDLRLGCPVSSYYSFSSAGECETVCLTETLPSGDWVVFVSTDGWLAIPCGADYILTLDFQPVTGVEDRGLPASWSAIKALYR